MAYEKRPYDPDLDLDNGELDAEKIAGGFLKGILKVAGFALMAVIAGYSAGVAQENYRASRERSSGGSSASAHR
jgi:hypothetical protein